MMQKASHSEQGTHRSQPHFLFNHGFTISILKTLNYIIHVHIKHIIQNIVHILLLAPLVFYYTFSCFYRVSLVSSLHNISTSFLWIQNIETSCHIDFVSTSCCRSDHDTALSRHSVNQQNLRRFPWFALRNYYHYQFPGKYHICLQT